MKKSINLYFQPYYFKNTSSDVFRGVNNIDIRTAAGALYAKLAKRLDKEPLKDNDIPNWSKITLAKYVLLYLRTYGTTMDIDDAHILNMLMSNVMIGNVKPIVTDGKDITAKQVNGLYYNFKDDCVIGPANSGERIDSKDMFGTTLLYPLDSTLVANFSETSQLEIEAEIKDNYRSESFVYIKDQSVNDFLSVLSKEIQDEDVIDFDIKDAIDVRWIDGKRVNSYRRRSDVDGVSYDGLIGIINCKPLLGKLLAKSRATKSTTKLRDDIVSYLYNDLLSKNKEDLLAGSELEALYLIGKRVN